MKYIFEMPELEKNSKLRVVRLKIVALIQHTFLSFNLAYLIRQKMLKLSAAIDSGPKLMSHHNITLEDKQRGKNHFVVKNSFSN